LAMAISCNPDILIADEPTTSLDVIVQSEILSLMKDLKRKLGLSIFFITHNLGIIAQIADKVAIIYVGRIMEFGDVMTIYKSPRHPYTKGLLHSIPRIDKSVNKLVSIKGDVPDMINPPTGCPFHPRCPYAKDYCSRKNTKLEEVFEGHFTACLRDKQIN
jgi:oligopeptide/dipeptide ABC transporter ATP-binding protein